MKQRGFSLLELTAVLAILAILAATLVPNIVKRVDAAIYRKESTDLLACADALQSAVLRNRSIPGPNWAAFIAAEMGTQVSSVTNNLRGIERKFLIDPNFRIGTNGQAPPYTQTMQGSVLTDGGGNIIPPSSPRMILISSIGLALPNFPAPGTLTAADFDGIWNAVNFTIPPGPSWGTWAGRAEDLVVQRINLSGVFAHIVIFNYPAISGQTGYSIDRLGTNYFSDPFGTNMYVIKNTLLGLADVLQSQFTEQVINHDGTFVYANGVWRNSIYEVPGDTALSALGIANKFIASRWNKNAGVTQSNVVVGIRQYMDAYSAYAASGWDVTAKANAQAAQAVMMTAINSLINGPVEGNCQ